MGGTIIATESPFPTIDSVLYVVKWDNGKVSRHYYQELFCIGRFKSRADFVAAIEVTGHVQVTRGPQGGFRKVRLIVEFEGTCELVEVGDSFLWTDVLQPKAEAGGLETTTITLPPKPRLKSKKKE